MSGVLTFAESPPAGDINDPPRVGHVRRAIFAERPGRGRIPR